MASQPREQLVAMENWAGVSSALGAKANGAWLNHAGACRLPSFQLLFSSIFSLGGYRLGAYAAANTLLNARAERAVREAFVAFDDSMSSSLCAHTSGGPGSNQCVQSTGRFFDGTGA